MSNPIINVKATTIGGVVDTTPDYTIVFLPDTQHMCSNNGSSGGNGLTMWEDMYNWIVNNKSAQNIVAVVSEGDITDDHTTTAFQNGLTGFQAMVSAGIPCIPAIGNHDYDAGPGSYIGAPPSGYARLCTIFNSYFGPAANSNYWSGQSFYGGAYTADNVDGTVHGENCYIKVTTGTHNILILSIEMFPRPAVLTWFQGIINANPTYEVIVMSHAYLSNDGTLPLIGDMYSSGTYGCSSGVAGTMQNGSSAAGLAPNDLWQQFIAANPNIVLCIGGHFLNALAGGGSTPPTNYFSDIGNYGNLIHNIFANYQEVTGGNGFMMLAKFSPSNGTISISFYSPYVAGSTGVGILSGGLDTGENAPYVLAYHPPQAMNSLPANDIAVLRQLKASGVTRIALGNNGFIRFNNKDLYNCNMRAADVTMDSSDNLNIDATNHLLLNANHGGAVKFPAMITTAKTALTGVSAGMIVFDTTLNTLSVYNGTTWLNVPLTP